MFFFIIIVPGIAFSQPLPPNGNNTSGSNGSSADAFGTVTIVIPISISKISDMDFGNLAVSSLPGTVILLPTGSRIATGGVTLPVMVGNVTAATFDITGVPGYTYSITLPSIDITLYNGPNNTMVVNIFSSNPTPTGMLGPAGQQTLSVGATLNVAGNQLSGIYTTSTPFSVTVNYN